MSIAYSTSGSGPVLVLARAWITHLELMWAEASFRRFIEGLGDICTVVRYDGRGNGLSDRAVDLPTLDDLVRDLAAVVDAVSAEPVRLWGSSFGGPVAIAYAARRPERVERLILEGSFATLHDQLTPAERVTMIEVGRLLQSSPEIAATAISYMTDPAPSSRHERRVARIVASVEPEMLRHLYTLAARIDVRPLLGDLRVPTLVMHRRGSRVFPFHCSRALARRSPAPGSSLSTASSTTRGKATAAPALAAMRTFLGGGATPAPSTVTLAVQRHGLVDRAAAAPGRHGGVAAVPGAHEAPHRGGGGPPGHVHQADGRRDPRHVHSASAAVRCAVAVRDEIATRNTSASTALQLRIGLAAGEPLPDGDDLFGSVVHLAARVCTAARPEEVLVTDAVYQLVDAKGFRFGAARSVRMKGFAQPVRVRPVLTATG